MKVLTIGTKARCLEPSSLLVLRAPVCRRNPNSPFAAARQAASAFVHDAPSWDPENPRLRARPPAHFIGFQLQLSPSPFALASLPVRSWKFKVRGLMFLSSSLPRPPSPSAVDPPSPLVTSASRRVTLYSVKQYDRRRDPATLRLPSFPGRELRPHPRPTPPLQTQYVPDRNQKQIHRTPRPAPNSCRLLVILDR